MSIFCLFAFSGVLLVVLIDVLAYTLLLQYKDRPPARPKSWPKVAVLIAARNEASTLPRCFAALEKLDYPADKLTVWIGNDASEDDTLSVAMEAVSGRANWHVLDVKEQWGRARGKANVLAQLTQGARNAADYYFVTDADVAVSSGWIKCILRFFRPGVGLLSGTSVVEGRSPFARLQAFDWALAMGLAKAFTYVPRFGQTLTAIGNNMAIERKAYEAVGGYENIPFSITEDYELHRQLKKKGYESLHISLEQVKARNLPVKDWGRLLHQRKRWMSGALQLPKTMVAILFVQALFFPSILIILFWNPFWGTSLLLLKLLAQGKLVRKMLFRLGETAPFPFLGYELYSFLLSMSLLLFYFLPIPVYWKGRPYR